MAKRRKKRFNIRTKAKKNQTTGGLAFFLSFTCLAILLCVNLPAVTLLWDSYAYNNFLYATAGLSLGVWFAHIFIKGRLNVFLHEFKHALLSGLVGNKAKTLEVAKETGRFTYKYTESNAKYNALIALAPYFFPLCTSLALLFALVFFRSSHEQSCLVVAIGLGADLCMNFRDAQPHQSDISNITGGYAVGYIFIILMNANICLFLAAWILQGHYGLRILAATMWEFGVHLFWYFRNR